MLELPASHAEPQPDEVRQHKLLFSTQYSHGYFIASLNCGIIAGLALLWEDEGMEVVTSCLDSISEDPASRPDLIFYNNACRLRRYRLHHPDESWHGTRHFVDTGDIFLSRFKQALLSAVNLIVRWPSLLARQGLDMGSTCSTFPA